MAKAPTPSSAQIEAFVRSHCEKVKRQGKEIIFLCPFHEDHRASNSVNGETGLWMCQACGERGNFWDLAMRLENCDFKEALRRVLGQLPALGRSAPAGRSRARAGAAAALVGSQPEKPISPEIQKALAIPDHRLAEIYCYVDATGAERFAQVRYEPKDFRTARPDGRGGYVFGMGDTEPTLYRLPKVLGATQVFVLEGEKDVHSGEGLGFTATCNPHGAGKWKPGYNEALRGKDVVIIPDNDNPGEQHAAAVAASLYGVARSVKIVRVPYGKDLSDWVAEGATRADVERAVTAAPVWQPPEPAPVTGADSAPPVAGPRSKSTAPQCPAVPDEAWYGLAETYRQAVTLSSEAPDNYHLAGFLVAAGAVLGRSVYYTMSRRVYPNLYAVLVGDSGWSRKGSAQHFAMRLLHEACPVVRTMISIDSAEGLIQFVAKAREEAGGKTCVPVIACLAEIRALLDKSAKEGLGNIIPNLCDAYDCPDRLETNTKIRPLAADQPWLALFAGTTQSWLDRLKLQDIEGGLGNRLMYFPGVHKAAIAHPPDPPTPTWNELVKQLHDVHQCRRDKGPTQFSFSPEACALWDPFYESLRAALKEEPLISTLAAREHLHCLKAAIIFAALDRSSTISADHLQPAIALTRYLHAGLGYLFTDYGASEMARLDARIVEKVKAAGAAGLRKRTLQRNLSRVDADTFNRRIKALTEVDGPLESHTDGRRIVLVYRED
jgi:hypothetical protein